MSEKIEATDITEEEAQNAAFFDRADQFIKQANDFCRDADRGEVGAALLFAATRFNTWVSANSFKDGEEMRDAKAHIMGYFMQQFQAMLEDNFDEYCEQFENYLRFRKAEEFHQHKHDHDDDHKH